MSVAHNIYHNECSKKEKLEIMLKKVVLLYVCAQSPSSSHAPKCAMTIQYPYLGINSPTC